jgi:hypothetical protein
MDALPAEGNRPEMPGSTEPEMSFTCGPPVSSTGGGASGNET